MTKLSDVMNDYNVNIKFIKWSIGPSRFKEKYNDEQQKVLIEKAFTLYTTMKKKNAKDDELLAAWCYLRLCIDAKKWYIDMNRIYKDFGIMYLKRKYLTNKLVDEL